MVYVRHPAGVEGDTMHKLWMSKRWTGLLISPCRKCHRYRITWIGRLYQLEGPLHRH